MRPIYALRVIYGSYRVARWHGCVDGQSVEVFRAKTADNINDRGARFLAGYYQNSCPLSQETFSGLLKLCAQHVRESGALVEK